MRTPLALRLSPQVRDALTRRARAEGVDPDGEQFGEWVGNLLLDELPDALAEAARDVLSPHVTNAQPELGAVSESAKTIAEQDHTARRPVKGAGGGAP